MKEPIKVLGVFGGSIHERSDSILRGQMARLLDSMREKDALVEYHELGKVLKKLENTLPSKAFLSEEAVFLAGKVRWADILIIATPVHWRLPSLTTVAFIHHVLAPLEWGGMENGGYECWGKVCATMINCDDDGAAMVGSSLHDTLNHMGFVSPPWSAHHKNIMMLNSEDDWQNNPGAFGPILLETAKRMRGFPSPHEFSKK